MTAFFEIMENKKQIQEHFNRAKPLHQPGKVPGKRFHVVARPRIYTIYLQPHHRTHSKRHHRQTDGLWWLCFGWQDKGIEGENVPVKQFFCELKKKPRGIWKWGFCFCDCDGKKIILKSCTCIWSPVPIWYIQINSRPVYVLCHLLKAKQFRQAKQQSSQNYHQ